MTIARAFIATSRGSDLQPWPARRAAPDAPAGAPGTARADPRSGAACARSPRPRSAPHMRPWHGPMPQRVNAFTRLASVQPCVTASCSSRNRDLLAAADDVPGAGRGQQLERGRKQPVQHLAQRVLPRQLHAVFARHADRTRADIELAQPHRRIQCRQTARGSPRRARQGCRHRRLPPQRAHGSSHPSHRSAAANSAGPNPIPACSARPAQAACSE